jgi:ankyrin repeat protein
MKTQVTTYNMKESKGKQLYDKNGNYDKEAHVRDSEAMLKTAAAQQQDDGILAEELPHAPPPLTSLDSKRGGTSPRFSFIAKREVNSVQKKWRSIRHAAEKGNLTVMEWFLVNGADIHETDEAGNTALNYAAGGGQVEAMEWLKAHGASIEKDEIGLQKGASALHLAAHAGQVVAMDWLVTEGVDVNITDTNGLTAVHYAAQGGKALCVMEWLAAHGANLGAVDMNGFTAMHSATQQNNVDILEWLFNQGLTPLTKCNIGATGMHYAATRAHLEAMAWLIAHGVDVNDVDLNGATALDNAARAGRVDAMAWLVKHGANVMAKRNDDGTAFHSASVFGHTPAMEWLLANGADLGAVKKSKYTALHLAAQFDRMEAVVWLIGRIDSMRTLRGFVSAHCFEKYSERARRAVNELVALARMNEGNLIKGWRLVKQWAGGDSSDNLAKGLVLVQAALKDLPNLKEAIQLEGETQKCMEIAADDAMASLLEMEAEDAGVGAKKKKKTKKEQMLASLLAMEIAAEVEAGGVPGTGGGGGGGGEGDSAEVTGKKKKKKKKKKGKKGKSGEGAAGGAVEDSHSGGLDAGVDAGTNHCDDYMASVLDDLYGSTEYENAVDYEQGEDEQEEDEQEDDQEVVITAFAALGVGASRPNNATCSVGDDGGDARESLHANSRLSLSEEEHALFASNTAKIILERRLQEGMDTEGPRAEVGPGDCEHELEQEQQQAEGKAEDREVDVRLRAPVEVEGGKGGYPETESIFGEVPMVLRSADEGGAR